MNKSFVYYGKPQLHLNRPGVLLVHVPKEHMKRVETYLVDIRNEMDHFKVYKKYELGEILFFVKTLNGQRLQALFESLQQFLVETCNILLSQAESRAKFRRKVKSWIKKLESMEQEEKEKITSPFSQNRKTTNTLQHNNLNRQSTLEYHQQKANYVGKESTRLTNILSERDSEQCNLSLWNREIKNNALGSLLKRKEAHLREQLGVQLRDDYVPDAERISEIKGRDQIPFQGEKLLMNKSIEGNDTKNQIQDQTSTFIGGKLSAQLPQPQTILHVNGINLSKTNGLKGLCCLFRNFGHIQRAVFNTVKCYALVQFDTHESATSCIQILDGLDLGGDDIMCVTFSKKLSLNNLKGPQSIYLNYRGDPYVSEHTCLKGLSNCILLELGAACVSSNRAHRIESIIYDKCHQLRLHPMISRPRSTRNKWICSFASSGEAVLSLMHLHGLVEGNQSIRASLYSL